MVMMTKTTGMTIPPAPLQDDNCQRVFVVALAKQQQHNNQQHKMTRTQTPQRVCLAF
jgi:hypothetical protein